MGPHRVHGLGTKIFRQSTTTSTKYAAGEKNQNPKPLRAGPTRNHPCPPDLPIPQPRRKVEPVRGKRDVSSNFRGLCIRSSVFWERNELEKREREREESERSFLQQVGRERLVFSWKSVFFWGREWWLRTWNKKVLQRGEVYTPQDSTYRAILSSDCLLHG